MTSSISPLVAMQGTLEKMADKFTEALPRQMDVNKFISVAKLTLNKNPKLLQADKTSLMQTFMKAAQDGLYLDGREAAAVQYGNQVNYLPMVEGVIKLMHNSGLIKTISAEVVYENFEDNPWVDIKAVIKIMNKNNKNCRFNMFLYELL